MDNFDAEQQDLTGGMTEVDLLDDTPIVPIKEVEMAATISTLASKRLEGEATANGETLDQRYGRFYELVKLGREDSIRAELSAVRNAEARRFVRDELNSSGDSLSEEYMNALVDVEVGLDENKENFAVIEKHAAEQLVEDSIMDPTARAAVMANELVTPPELPSIMDIKQMSLENGMVAAKQAQKYMGKVSDKPLQNTVGEAALLMVPFTQTLYNDQNIKTSMDAWLPGEDLEEQKAVWDNMSIEEKTKTAHELDKVFEGRGLDLQAAMFWGYMHNLTGFDVFMENVMTPLDIISANGIIAGLTSISPVRLALGVAAKTVGAVGDVASLAVKTKAIQRAITEGKAIQLKMLNGDTQGAAADVVAAREAAVQGALRKDSIIAEDAAEATMPSSMLPDTDRVGPHVGNLVDEFMDVTTPSFVNSAERGEVVAKATMEHTEDLLNAGMPTLDEGLKFKDADIVNTAQGGVHYRAIYGDHNGKGFSSVEAAETMANAMKIEGYRISTLEETGGLHYITFEKNMEFGKFLPTYDVTKLEQVGGFRQLVGKTMNWVEDTVRTEARRISASREITLNAGNKLVKVVNKLGKDEKQGLTAVLQRGIKNEEWYDEVPNSIDKPSLAELGMNAKQIDAYHAVRAMDEVLDRVQNTTEYNRLKNLGFMSLSLKGNSTLGDKIGTFTGKMLDNVDFPESKSIFSVEKNRFLTREEARDVNKLLETGYRIVKPNGAKDMGTNHPVQLLLVKEGSVKVDPLLWRQVPKVDGGRIRYSQQNFAKIGRVRTGPNGSVVGMKAHTFAVGSAEEIDKFVESANKTIQIIRNIKAGKFADDEAAILALDNASANSFQLKSMEDMEKLLYNKETNPSGVIDLQADLRLGVDNPLIVENMRDGEQLKSVNGLLASKKIDMLAEDMDMSNTVQNLIRDNKQFRQRDRLKTWDGGEAPLVNPIESAVLSLEKAANLISISTWKEKSASKFFHSFKDILDHTDGKTPMQHFLDPTYNPGARAEDILVAEAMQKHFKIVMNTPTQGEQTVNRLYSQTIQSISPLLHKLGANEALVQNMADMKPIQFLRSLSYNSKLGMLNPKQPFIQAQASVAMASIEPVYGPQGVLMAIPMRFMLMSENSETLGKLGTVAAKFMSKVLPHMKADDIHEAHDVLKRSGTWRLIGGAISEQDDVAGLSSKVAGTPSRYFGNMLEFGKAPVMATERFNKIGSTMTAYLKWKKANPKAKVTDDVIDQIRDASEVMVASMDRMDHAVWQRGVSGAFTQFWGHQASMIEMMLPEILGGAATLTEAQKWRLRVGQVGLYGVGGTMGVEVGHSVKEGIGEAYQAIFGTDIDPDMMELMEDGIADQGLSYLLGHPVKTNTWVGLQLNKFGPIGWLSDPNNFMAVNSSPFTTGTGYVKAFGALLSDLSEVAVEYDDPAAFSHVLLAGQSFLRDTLSSYTPWEQGYIGTVYGKMLAKSGATVGQVTAFQAMMNTLGVTPEVYLETYSMKTIERNKKGMLKSDIKGGVHALNYANRNKDPSVWRLYQKRLVNTHTPEDTVKILTSVYKKVGDNEFFNLVKNLSGPELLRYLEMFDRGVK